MKKPAKLPAACRTACWKPCPTCRLAIRARGTFYIDPPYNTHSAFEHYDDNLEHSIRLSTIYLRLELLRQLLREDGSIWVSKTTWNLLILPIPANRYYQGRFIWNKHNYPLVGELESEGEEFECAQAIDRNMAVRCWVRNLAEQKHSFRLPTASDYFYPDFVALHNDGRVLFLFAVRRDAQGLDVYRQLEEKINAKA